MNAAILKFVPTSLVIGAGGFLAWPYIGPDAPQWDSAALSATVAPASPAAAAKPASGAPAPGAAAKAENKKEIPVHLLNPLLPSPPKRDPFIDPEAARSVARARVSQSLRAMLEAQLGISTKDGKGNSRGGSTVRTTAARAGSAAAAAPAADPLAGLSLTATYSFGSKGAAIINGAIYEPGQAIKLDPTPPGLPLQLAEVRKNSVMIRQGSRLLELKYASLDAGAAAGSSAPKSGGKSAPAKAGGAKGKAKKGYDPFDI